MARALPMSGMAAEVCPAGTSRATGSPRLAMTTSSPAWTDLISCDNRILASKILTCTASSFKQKVKAIIFSYYGQVGLDRVEGPDRAADPGEELGRVDLRAQGAGVEKDDLASNRFEGGAEMLH